MATCDVVSLHLLLTDDTRGMIGEPLLRSMKPGALLINTARAEADRQRRPGGSPSRADRSWRHSTSFETEPLAADSPLRGLSNVILSPHQGYNTPESLDRIARRGRRQHRKLPRGQASEHRGRAAVLTGVNEAHPACVIAVPEQV